MDKIYYEGASREMVEECLTESNNIHELIKKHLKNVTDEEGILALSAVMQFLKNQMVIMAMLNKIAGNFPEAFAKSDD